jgi:hypothetical protein
MKSLLLALALITGLNAHASTIDGYSLPINGQQSVENFTLNAVQTRTEYRSETQANTCWRTVFAGYRQVCRQEPVTSCWPGPDGRQFCDTRWITQCYQEAQYRQEAYTCYQTVQIPYEVFNNYVRALVSVKLPNIPTGSSLPQQTCNIDFRLEGGSFSSYANCSEFIVIASRTSTESREDQTVIQDRKFDITLLDAKTVTAPVRGGIGEMRLEGQTLVFRTGDLTKNPNFSLKLFVERRKLLKGDETLINRNLAPGEYTFEKTSDDYGTVRISLSKLFGGINAKRKHLLKVDINVLTDTANSINPSLPSMSASESIVVNE